MGTGNTILYWYAACGIFVFVFAGVVAALMIVGRRRGAARYRTTSLERRTLERRESDETGLDGSDVAR